MIDLRNLIPTDISRHYSFHYYNSCKSFNEIMKHVILRYRDVNFEHFHILLTELSYTDYELSNFLIDVLSFRRKNILVKHLLTFFTDINTKNIVYSHFYKSILGLLIYKNCNLHLIQYCIELGADTNSSYLMEQACGSGAVHIIKYFIEIGIKMHDLNELLYICVRGCRHVPTIQYFIQHGAEVHQLTKNGQNRLIETSTSRKVSEYLILLGLNGEPHKSVKYIVYRKRFWLAVFVRICAKKLWSPDSNYIKKIVNTFNDLNI